MADKIKNKVVLRITKRKIEKLKPLLVIFALRMLQRRNEKVYFSWPESKK
jgi:hypothetical protein